MFKPSVMNLDHMMEVGLQKKKRKNFYLPTQSDILDEARNKQFFFFFCLSESKCRTVLLESVASKTDHDQHVIHAMSLHMII